MANQDNQADNWFTEAELPYSQQDVRISARYTQVLFDQKSEFGHVQIFDTPFYGRMLTLDGIIQVAEKDEFIYHETMITLPAIKHGNPKSVLIVGGGDGGAVKQATRLPSVERIVMVEIDQSVIDMCQKYIPSVAGGSLSDPRVEVITADGKDYVENCTETFDIVALDLTDPVPDGPAEALFEETFYRSVKKVLNPGGYMTTHCGSLLFQPEEAKALKDRLQTVFAEVALHSAVIPTYQLSSFGFLLATDSPSALSRDQIDERFKALPAGLQYLSTDVIVSSTVLPPYLAEKLT